MAAVKIQKSGPFFYYVNPEGDSVVIQSTAYNDIVKDGETALCYPSNINGLPVVEINEENKSMGNSEKKEAVVSAIEKIVIPENVEHIGKSAFSHFTNVREVSLPSTLRFIDSCAFFRCSHLSAINFPKNLIKIGSAAFSRNGLKEIELPDSLAFLGSRAFEACHNLRKIVFPKLLAEIPERVCAHCTSLAEVVFPVSLRAIQEEAFYCSKLAKVNLPDSIGYVGKIALSSVTEATFQNERAWCDPGAFSRNAIVNGKPFYNAFDVANGVYHDTAPRSLADDQPIEIPAGVRIINYINAECSTNKLIFQSDCEFVRDFLGSSFKRLILVLNHHTPKAAEVNGISYLRNLYIEDTALTLPCGANLTRWRRATGIQNGEFTVSDKITLWVGKCADGADAVSFDYQDVAQTVSK